MNFATRLRSRIKASAKQIKNRALDSEIQETEQVEASKPVDDLSPALLPPLRKFSQKVERETTELSRASSSDARAFVPFAVALDYEIFPLCVLSHSEGRPLIAALSGRNLSATELQQLRSIANAEFELESYSREKLLSALREAYLGASETLELAVTAANHSGTLTRGTPAPLSILISDGEVPNLLAALMQRAHRLRASDLHIEPFGNLYRLRFRICGTLRTEEVELQQSVGPLLLRHIKVLCSLDTTDRHTPLEGAYSFVRNDISLRVRVSIVPQIGGEKCVLRFFSDQASHTDFDGLGLKEKDRQLLTDALSLETGAIILSGPTGSGKTTLLYTSIESLNDGERNIVTIEDPVERLIKGTNQMEVDRDRSLGFNELLVSVLRQDPDVIMLGEIREGDSARSALHAALTGHLVLSTVHAANSIEVFLRLLRLCNDVQLMLSALKLVSAQRLLPLNCRHCATRTEVPRRLSELLAFSGVGIESTGCSACDFLGENGRIGVYEFLPIGASLGDPLLEFLQNPVLSTRKLLFETAYANGYEPYAIDVRKLLIQGDISPKTAAKVLGIRQNK